MGLPLRVRTLISPAYKYCGLPRKVHFTLGPWDKASSPEVNLVTPEDMVLEVNLETPEDKVSYQVSAPEVNLDPPEDKVGTSARGKT